MGFDINIFNSFDEDWALVTAGTIGHFNTMTVSWGGLGTLWNLPAATVYIRQSRYTHEFLDNNEFFTVSFFPKAYRNDLDILGSRSGRECDKLALTSLTPEALEGAVKFREAEQTILCRKIYRQDMDPSAIPQSVLDKYYQKEPIHTVYIGEVLKVL